MGELIRVFFRLDGATMDIVRLDPEMQDAYRRLPKTRFSNPFVRVAIQLKSRLTSFDIDPPKGITKRDIRLKSSTLRLYIPQTRQSNGAVLWAHGGGYAFGGVGLTDYQCLHLAKSLGVVVASVDYRLAPRYPFPAAHNDCYDAWRYLLEQVSSLEIAADNIALAGQSAGAGLMAGLIQRLVDENGIQPKAQVLIYPMIDDRTAAEKKNDVEDHFLWNNRSNRAAWGWYLNTKPGKPESKAYSVPARRKNLEGLPIAWVGVGELDLFYEETTRYVSQLENSSVDHEFVIVPGAPHGFDVVASRAEASKLWVRSYVEFLRQIFAS